MGTLENYKGKKVAILGYGDEGQSARRYYQTAGAQIHIFDEKSRPDYEKLSNLFQITVAPAKDWKLDDFDLVVRSPGINPHKYMTSSKTTSVTREFFNRCPAPIIGVTGTKGKGTTATLVSKILQKSDIKTRLLGNIGRPALDELNNISENDVVVYELSSFQLWDMDSSPHVAVVLMIQPEHLDVHEGQEDYIEAKSQITLHQSKDDVVIYHPTNRVSKRIAEMSLGIKYRYLSDEAANIINNKLVIAGTEIIDVSEFGLLGPHNQENICAALSASWQLCKDVEAAKASISEFHGLEHRLELAGQVEGVRYYNDSFATVPEASIAAMKSFQEPEIVILGGSDKNSDYYGLAQYIKSVSNVKKVLLIGVMGPKIQQALDSVGCSDYQKVEGDMVRIVNEAKSLADEGDVVLLSPACASFDMFKSYKQRGELFKSAVKGL